MTTNQLLICLAIIIVLCYVYYSMNNRKKNHLGKGKSKNQTNDWEKECKEREVLRDYFQALLDKKVDKNKKIDKDIEAEVREWIKEQKSKYD